MGVVFGCGYEGIVFVGGCLVKGIVGYWLVVFDFVD